MPDSITYNHSVCNINSHFVWCVKYRKPVLTHDKDIRKIFKEICQRYSWTIKAIEVIPDHVHVFITTTPFAFDAPSKKLNFLKGYQHERISSYSLGYAKSCGRVIYGVLLITVVLLVQSLFPQLNIISILNV